MATSQEISHIVSQLLERNYSEINDYVNHNTFLLDAIKHGKFGVEDRAGIHAEVEGRKVILHGTTGVNPNLAIGVPEHGGKPRPGIAPFGITQWRNLNGEGAFGISAEVLNRGPGTPQSVTNIFTTQIDRLIKGTRSQENRWLHGDGSGLLATAVAASSWDNSAKTLEVDNARRFKVDQYIIVRAKQAGGWKTGTLPTNWTVTTGIPLPARITAVNKTTNKITLEYYDGGVIGDLGDSTASDSMGVYFWNMQGFAPWGLGNVCSTTNPQNHGFNPNTTLPADELTIPLGFGGVDRNAAGNEWWQARETVDLSGAPLSLRDHLDPMEGDFIERDGSAQQSRLIYTVSNHAIYRQIIYQLEQAKVTFERKRIETGNWEVVQHGIFTSGWDWEAPEGTLRCFAPRDLYFMQLEPWGFVNLGGSVFTQERDPLNFLTNDWMLQFKAERQLLCKSVLLAGQIIGIGS